MVFSFISEGSYPLTLNRGQRQTLRTYALKFSIHAGDLFYGALPDRRAVLSKEEAWNLFKEFHASPMGGNTGIVKTRSAMCSRFYWPGMTADIEKWVSQCDGCQRVGPPLQVVRELECIKVSGVWELIGIDLTGPMPLTSCGNQYILTATDYFSKWVEAFPLKTKTAEEKLPKSKRCWSENLECPPYATYAAEGLQQLWGLDFEVCRNICKYGSAAVCANRTQRHIPSQTAHRYHTVSTSRQGERILCGMQHASL